MKGFYSLHRLLILPGILASALAFGQLTVNNAVNATDGVQSILLGEGVTASNITFSGANEQIGGFTCTGCNLGLGTGLVMGSGNVDGAPGPNTSGSASLTPASGWGVTDPDLAELSGFSLNDAAVLQFDFVPTGDSLAFNFVFGSDEYPEFANSGFNDAFGFFLSGPGISGPYSNNAANIALIPGTTIPVTINNVNNGTSGTGPCEYCQYYVHNPNSFNSPATSIECDGFTTVLTAYAEVVCGETYHIKLAIADAGDTGYDSFVFLEAGSFQSNQVSVAFTAPGISPGTDSVYEGCDPALLTFTRPGGTSGEQAYVVEFAGTALNGVDFELINDTLIFAANQNTATIPVYAIDDNTTEGTETLIVTLSGTSVCSSGEVTYTINLIDLPPLTVTQDDVVIDCGEEATLAPSVSGGIGFYTVIWEATGAETPSLTVSPDVATTYTYTVLDTCGVDPFEGAVDVTFPDYPDLVVDLGEPLVLTCLESVEIIPTVSGGYGSYTYSWEMNATPISSDATLSYVAPGEGDIELVVTDECGIQGVDAVDLTFPPVPILVDLGDDLSVTCLDESLLTASVSGGVGAYSYQWNEQGGGVIGNGNTLDFQTGEDTSVILTVSDECGNEGTDAIDIAVPQVAMFIDLGPDQDVSCIDVTTLGDNASGGVGQYYYTWNVNGQVAGFDETVDVQTDDQATVFVTVEDECGNATSDQLVLTVPSVPVNVDAGPDISTGCLTENQFVGSATGGVGEYSYLWTDGQANLSLEESCSYQTMNDATLTLIVTDECGNTASDALNISIPAVPIAISLPPDTTICIGDLITIAATASGGVGELSYSWTPDVSAYQVFSDAPGESTVYTVQVSDVCGNTNSASVGVIVDDVYPGFTVEYIGDFGIQVTNQSDNAESVVWYFSDGTLAYEDSPFHTFYDMNPWEVTLQATSPLGCVRSVTEIFYPEANIYIPNCFTPDADGINDVFFARGHDLKWFKIWIFNRWGEMVFYTEDIDQPWDGSHKGSEHFVPDGVYNYRIEAEGIRGNFIRKDGNVLIIR